MRAEPIALILFEWQSRVMPKHSEDPGLSWTVQRVSCHLCMFLVESPFSDMGSIVPAKGHNLA